MTDKEKKLLAKEKLALKKQKLLLAKEKLKLKKESLAKKKVLAMEKAARKKVQEAGKKAKLKVAKEKFALRKTKSKVAPKAKKVSTKKPVKPKGISRRKKGPENFILPKEMNLATQELYRIVKPVKFCLLSDIISKDTPYLSLIQELRPNSEIVMVGNLPVLNLKY